MVSEEPDGVWEVDSGLQLNQIRVRVVSYCSSMEAVPCRIDWLLR